MNAECPHSYYPRPTMVRNSFFSLNGSWDFSIGNSDKGEEYGEKILVPFPPESTLSGIGRRVSKKDYLHYRRTFTLPEGFINGRVILHFGAIDGEGEVFIGDTSVGYFSPSPLPRSFDITDALKDGENTVSLTVRDSQDRRYPYGKQKDKRGGMWYTPHSGIWQAVWLESVPLEYIERIKITPSTKGALIEVTAGEGKKTLTLESGEVYGFEGNSIFVNPEKIRLWSPEDPYLYRFTLQYKDDEIKSYFALREVGTGITDGKPHLTLNGKPYLFNGLLDQGYYSDGIILPATEEAYLDDIRLAKSLGFNMLRKHIKIEPEIFYYYADREGIAVFQDMVNNGGYSFFRDTVLPTVGLQKIPDFLIPRSKMTKENFKENMLATVELLFNHPSIVYYTVFNEGWGQFSADKMYELIKSKDKTRIIDTTSGWFRQKKSDVDSRHIYFRRLAVKKPDGRPVVISEFGGYSYRIPGHLATDKNYGYRLLETRDEFENAFFELYENEVVPLARLGASAFVYTQLSDVEDETNGLITYDRECVKLDAEKTKSLMSRLYKEFLS